MPVNTCTHRRDTEAEAPLCPEAVFPVPVTTARSGLMRYFLLDNALIYVRLLPLSRFSMDGTLGLFFGFYW